MEGKRGLIYMLLKSMLPLGVPFLKNFVTVTSWLGGGVSLPFLLSFGNLITKKQKVGFLGKVRSFGRNGQRRNITSSIPFTFYWNILFSSLQKKWNFTVKLLITVQCPLGISEVCLIVYFVDVYLED